MPRRRLGKTDGTRLYADQWPGMEMRAKAEGVTVSDVVRDAIDAHLGNPVDPPDLRARLKAEVAELVGKALDEWKGAAP